MDQKSCDRSGLGAIEVDAASRTVRVGGGCLWREVHTATRQYGLAVPSGIWGNADVGDFSIGGGVGHLARKYGLAIDNLVDAEVVRADGRRVGSADEGHPGLLRALGRGGDLCVATRLTFRLHAIGAVVGGSTLWPLSQAPAVTGWFRDFIGGAPEELSGFVILTTLPADSAQPHALPARKVCGVVWCHLGTATQAERDLAPVRRLPSPLVSDLRVMPFAALQRGFDASCAPGLQWRRRVVHTRRLDDAAIASHTRHAHTLPTPHSSIRLFPLNAAARGAAQARECRIDRGARWVEVAQAVSVEATDEPCLRQWCKSWWDDLDGSAEGDRCLDGPTHQHLSRSEA